MVTLALYIPITILQQYPQMFNYPVKIKPDNLPTAYKFTVRVARCAKLFLTLAIGYMGYETYSIAVEDSYPKLGGWFFPIVLIVSLGLTIYPIVRLCKLK